MKVLPLLIFFLSWFLVLNSPLFPDEFSEQEIIEKITECFFQKKSKRQDVNSETKEGEINSEPPILKKELPCQKEQFKSSLNLILNSTKNTYIKDKILFTGLFSVFVILILVRQYSLNKKIKKLEEKLNQSLLTIHDILDANSKQSKTEVLDLKLMTLDARQRGTEETIQILLNQKQSSSMETEESPNHTEEPVSIFYMTFPKMDGSFPQSSKRKSQNNSSYKFFPIDESHAEFELSYQSDMLGRILNGVEIYIEPACESANPLDFGALMITNLERGIAVKEGNHWKIIQKAKIRYD
jgi:hypothetical protein